MQFNVTETTVSIQESLQAIYKNRESVDGMISFDQFYLVAQSHAAASFYNITDYIQRCIAGDISIAERLYGRTLLYIYQSEKNADDLLSDSGVNAFINRFLLNYMVTYGAEHLIGFAIDLPRFLSVFESDVTSVAWSSQLLQRIQEDHVNNSRRRPPTNERSSFLPFLFYDMYDSPIIKSIYWQELTAQFANCFLSGLSYFCNQHDVKLAITVPANARLLQYDLGTLLDKVDCSILIVTEMETPRHFVVAKAVCSNVNHAGILRKHTHTFSHYKSDSIYGFNQWLINKVDGRDSDFYYNESVTQILQTGQPKRPILMLSPTQSLWMRPEEKQWNAITKAWGWLCQTVWKLGYDFDIVSEAQFFGVIIEKNRGVICFNGNGYPLILLPSCISLHESTVNCLTNFLKAKGRLFINAPVPYLLNGRIGVEPYPLERLIYRPRTTILEGPHRERKDNLKKLLRKWIKSPILLYTGPENEHTTDVQVHHRVHEDYHTFYLYNTVREQIETLVEIDGETEFVEECHLQSGKHVPLTSWHANGKTYLYCSFEAKQVKLLVISSY